MKYVVLKDDMPELMTSSKQVAIDIANEISGVNVDMPLADIDVWELEEVTNPVIGEKDTKKLIYSITWLAKEREANIFEDGK